MTLACLGLSLLAALPAADSPTPDVHQAYQQQRDQVGRTPDDQVRLALWCEAHGLPAERLKHLALAVLTDPSHTTARGLMGLVSYQGKWQRPEVVAEKVQADADQKRLLAEYDDRRSKAAYTADAQWRLALWCDEQGLAEQARAHLTAVTRLEPARDAAWRRLGYTRHDGRWMTDAQATAFKTEVEARKQADRHWEPLLKKWKGMLATPTRRAEAEAALREITDPLAVPTIARIFVTNRPADQATAARLLAQIDAPAASRVLAGLAVMSPDAEVRRASVETLKRRDPREFIRLWIALIRDPIKYEVKPVGGPGSPGELFVEGKKAHTRRVYAPPPVPEVMPVPGSTYGYDANGMLVLNQPYSWASIPLSALTNVANASHQPTSKNSAAAEMLARSGLDTKSQNKLLELDGAGLLNDPSQRYVPTPFGIQSIPNEYSLLDQLGFFDIGNRYSVVTTNQIQVPIGQMMAEANKTAAVAQGQLDSDVAAIEATNGALHRINEPVLQALQAVTGQIYGENSQVWNAWWTDQEGMAVLATGPTTTPTQTEEVPISYAPQFAPAQLVSGPTTLIRRHSCFGAGTAIRTVEGSRPIEKLSAGDRVLVQDPSTGALSYQPIVAVFHNPPNATLRITLDQEPVVVTGIHRFWKAGKGWTMARDLKVGDTVRTLGGVAAVTEVADAPVQPVFNLEVAEGRSFLVGSLGALVHDNSLVEPTPQPFDAPREVARRAD